ncbi:MAG: M20/M25/M40 family metallo-hydrolase [Acidobacteria bacterium]|nr:M20/M25/M40 family metallo-hydrolase [Acidobacteriota bacterium]
MPAPSALERYVDQHRHRLVEIVQDLVRIPSENTAPTGAEKACQEYLARQLRALGWEPSLYELRDVPGLAEHPLYWPGRDYTDRPNLGARRPGAGGGRSLLLTGHIDTVPRGTQPWTRDPFGGAVEGDRLYGRGSNDMKGGVATNLFVLEALHELGIRLAGDLVFETVVDEEFGGVNGTLAGRLAGFNADAAIISEPSFLRICPAQRGGRIAHIAFRSSGGILDDAGSAPGVVDQLTRFLNRVPEFAAARRQKARVHPYYANNPDPVPVTVAKIHTAPWGTGEPCTIPDTCRVEFYWQAMPGETQADIEAEFFAWLDSVSALRPEVEFPLRWLPGSALSRNEPLISELAASATQALGAEPVIVGIEGPCDMYVFHQAFGIPAVLYGARGGNTHSADEYLEIDTAVAAAKTLLLFVCRWCTCVFSDHLP